MCIYIYIYVYIHIHTHPYFSQWFEIKKQTFNPVYQKILTVTEHLVEKKLYTIRGILTSCFSKSIMTKFSHVLSEERYGKINPELRKMQMKPASKTCYLNTGCWEATKLRKYLLEIPSEPLHEAQWSNLPESKELKIPKPTVKTINYANTTLKKIQCFGKRILTLFQGALGSNTDKKKNPKRSSAPNSTTSMPNRPLSH